MKRVAPSCRPSARSAVEQLRRATSPVALAAPLPERRPAGAGRSAVPAAGTPASRPRPVVELRLEDVALEPAALPGGVVGVLDRRLGQGRGLARGGRRRRAPPTSRIRTPSDQPSETMWCIVTSDDVLAVAEPEQAGADERAAGQVERPPRLLARPAAAPRPRGRPRARSAEVVDRQGDRRASAAMTWTGTPALGREGGPQRPRGGGRPRRRPGRARRRRASPTSRTAIGMLYDGAARLELVEEPEPLLGERGGQRAVAVDRLDRRAARARRRPASAVLDQPGQAGDGRRRRGSRCSGGSTPNVSRTRARSWVGQERVAAQLEEVVVDADPVAAEQLGPDRRRAPPRSARGAGRRRRPGAPGPARGRAGRCGRPCRWASAAGRRARRTPRGPCTRAGGRRSQRRSSAAVGGRPVAGDEVGDQRASRPSRPRAPTTAASRTAGCARQRRLDLAELDPEAADLDLVVDPAQAFERAVGPPPGEVAGPVEPAARARRRTGRGGTARRSGRAGRGSPAPARRRRCTARPPRRPGPAGAGRRGRRAACWRSAGRSGPAPRPARPRRPSTRWSSRSARRGSRAARPLSSSRSARSRGSASPPQSIVRPGVPSQPDFEQQPPGGGRRLQERSTPGSARAARRAARRRRPRRGRRARPGPRRSAAGTAPARRCRTRAS